MLNKLLKFKSKLCHPVLRKTFFFKIVTGIEQCLIILHNITLYYLPTIFTKIMLPEQDWIAIILFFGGTLKLLYNFFGAKNLKHATELMAWTLRNFKLKKYNKR